MLRYNYNASKTYFYIERRMKTMKQAKRIFAVLLAVLMLCAVVPFAVQGADIIESGYCGGEGDGTNLTWTLDSDYTLTVSGAGTMKNYAYNIPGQYANAPWDNYRSSIRALVIESGVASIGNMAFEYCPNLESVTFGNGLTRIGNSTFSHCENLKSIEFPDSLIRIDDMAFFACTGLKNIKISDSLTNIGEWVFNFCTGLECIVVDENNPNYSSEDGILFNKDKTKLIQYPIGNARTEYRIPDSVTSIGNYAFELCNNLKSVEIPDSVTSLGDLAFSKCSNLESVIIGNNVTSISGWAFDYCEKLKYVFYTGSEKYWNQIEIGSDNDCLINAYIHYDSTWHTKGEANVIEKATCTKNGVASYQCRYCDFDFGTEEIEAGHTPGEPTETTTAPTCTADGEIKTTVRCTVCGEIIFETTEPIAALQHSYVATVTSPTCKEGGYTTYTCENCGDSYVMDYTDKLDHSDNDGDKICDNCGTHLSKDFRCKWCGKYEAKKDTPLKDIYKFVHTIIHTFARLTGKGWYE